ncbi:uncharacterized protein LOC110841515 [Zootermopsis nevadensis]|uniref:uncharacterized protein LOC110841515 n=1 Tax=Zootermopsis nevadensis TaxID=136037 RepID=UPI000B8EB67C|nr:uncharacterized protein LOC110841515 [Zootermopsis nevadensis]
MAAPIYAPYHAHIYATSSTNQDGRQLTAGSRLLEDPVGIGLSEGLCLQKPVYTKRRWQTSMTRVRFDPTIPVFERPGPTPQTAQRLRSVEWTVTFHTEEKGTFHGV